jgi:hypothetical protein
VTGDKKVSKYDLYKDRDGNISVKPKNGKGPGEPTGLNINFSRNSENNNMASSNKNLRAYFVIWGSECDPDDISNNTGLTPAKTWHVGDVRYENTGKRQADSGWRIDAPEDVEPTLDAHLEELMDLLWESRNYLKPVSKSCELQVTFVIHCSNTVPIMSISAANIGRLASLNASIDIDLYC